MADEKKNVGYAEGEGDSLAQKRAQRSKEIEDEARESGKLPIPVEQEEYWAAREADETAQANAINNTIELEKQANEQRKTVEEEKQKEFQRMREQILEQQGEQPAGDSDAPQNLDTHSRGKPEAGGGAQAGGARATGGTGAKTAAGRGNTGRAGGAIAGGAATGSK